MKRTTILLEALAVALAGCGSAIDNITPTNSGSTGGISNSTSASSSGTSGGSTGSTSTGGTTTGTSGTTGCTNTPPWETAAVNDSLDQPMASTTLPDDDNVDPACLAACDAAKDACIAPCQAAYKNNFILLQKQWLLCVAMNPILQCTTGICTLIYTKNLATITTWRNTCQSPCWKAFNQCQTDCGVKNNN
jgi:hypothetical protein